jgi:ectoine hydroxylase-related dioxygenase (phytanoyl-CoA dioxygenase family)
MPVLTNRQVQSYNDNGYLLVPSLYSVAELDAMEAAFDQIVARRVALRVGTNATWGGEKWREVYGVTDNAIIHCHDVQAYSAVWSRAILQERFTEALSQCMGCPNVQLHHTKLFQKPPEKGSPFPMHQDHDYFPHARHTMTAGVIYLTDSTEEMGCVAVYPGSHKLGRLETWEAHHLDPARYPLEKATLCEAKRGDVLIFNYLTIHGSGINRSSKPRKSVLVQTRDPDDKPLNDLHRSHAQGMMLRGVDPLTQQGTAEGTLGSDKPAVAPETDKLTKR